MEQLLGQSNNFNIVLRQNSQKFYKNNIQQSIKNRKSSKIQGFDQQLQLQQNFIKSKKSKQQMGDNFYKIPEAKPLLSKNFIDYSKPKVLIKQIAIYKQPQQLIAYRISSLGNDFSPEKNQLAKQKSRKTIVPQNISSSLSAVNPVAKASTQLVQQQRKKYQSQNFQTKKLPSITQSINIAQHQNYTSQDMLASKISSLTLWDKYVNKNGYQSIYLKYLKQHQIDELLNKDYLLQIGPQRQKMYKEQRKKLKLQLLKMCNNNQNLFNTYLIDLDFIVEAGTSLIRNLIDTKIQDVYLKWQDRLQQQRIQRQKDNQANQQPLNSRHSYDDIQFDSRFQCGNLFGVFQKIDKKSILPVEPRTFDLIIQNDTNTKGYTNWFYFSIKSPKKGIIKLNMVNMQKNYSLYNNGMKVLVFSYQKYKNQQVQWHRDGFNYGYKQNQILKIKDKNQRLNTLSFCIEQKYDNDVIYIAANVPYSYSRLLKFLDSIQRVTRVNSNIYFKRQNNLLSISSNVVPVLTLTWKRDKKDKSSDNNYKKKIIGIIARQHPGETVSSFVMEGFINSLVYLSNQSSVQLLKKYIFKIIPMFNVDGVIYGNSRCDVSGSDVNRRWSRNPNKFLYPVINGVKKLFQQTLTEGYQIDYFIDLHGHSKKLGTFIYACKVADQIQTRIFSWLMNKINNKFYFDNCIFGLASTKKQTARGSMFNNVINRKSMTVQTSFYGYRKINSVSSFKHFQIKQLHQIGQNLLSAIYADQTRDPKLYNWTNIKSEIKNYLQNSKSYNKSQQNQDQQGSGSDSDPQQDEMTMQQKSSSFLPAAVATKLGLVQIKVVQKSKNKKVAQQQNSRQKNQQQIKNELSGFNNQNADYGLNNLQSYFSKPIQSQNLENKLLRLKQTKSVTKISPFKFTQRNRKSFSTKKIRLAIDIKYVQNKQKMSIPSLLPQIQQPVVRKKKNFWSNFNKQVQNIIKQKKGIQEQLFKHKQFSLKGFQSQRKL